MSYFEANNISKVWDNFSISLSFEAQQASMTCIVGPSGCGKSTTLRLIAGLEKTNENMLIKLDGKDITKEKAGKRNIGLVSQNAALFLNMKVKDNVAYGLACRGINRKDREKEALKYLELFNLKGFADRYPDTLSGGEAQRVALARTLIVKPKLILFDEPFSALDAPLRKKLALEIKHLQKEISFTGIMVTHDIEEAKNIADKIILMRAGKKEWEGKSEYFFENMI